MENRIEPTTFINPDFNLSSQPISIQWHEVGPTTINAQAVYTPSEMVFIYRRKPMALIIWNDPIVDIIYTPETNFESQKIQSWLRKHIQDIMAENR